MMQRFRKTDTRVPGALQSGSNDAGDHLILAKSKKEDSKKRKRRSKRFFGWLSRAINRESFNLFKSSRGQKSSRKKLLAYLDRESF
jgi:hypothetical protein